MTSHRQLLTVVLLVGVSLSGCQVIEQHRPTQNGGFHHSPRAQFIIPLSAMQLNETNFSYNGRVDFVFQYDRERPFEDVVVCLYDVNGTVLNSTTIETLVVPVDVYNLSISSSEVPHSMVIDHPAFHQYPKEATTFMILKGPNRTGDGLGNFSEAQNAFPYPRHNETGRCM